MTTNPYATLGPADFLAALQGLLPTGDAWPTDPEALLTQLLAGLAAEQASAHARAGDLSERESDPAQTAELLPDWERAFGLPDPCVTAPQTLQQRRRALLARIAATGGQSIPYLTAVAAAIGYTVTITRMRPFRAGMSSAGDPAWGLDAFFVLAVNAPAETVTQFRAGSSTAGEPLQAWGNQQLECEMNRICHGYGKFLFSYGG